MFRVNTADIEPVNPHRKKRRTDPFEQFDKVVRGGGGESSSRANASDLPGGDTGEAWSSGTTNGNSGDTHWNEWEPETSAEDHGRDPGEGTSAQGVLNCN